MLSDVASPSFYSDFLPNILQFQVKGSNLVAALKMQIDAFKIDAALNFFGRALVGRGYFIPKNNYREIAISKETYRVALNTLFLLQFRCIIGKTLGSF